ncbi:hypothetical protein [Xanthomonas sp. GPE 39]|uniref:hypothetical protein n=1 Tax=Xanthomonas sp. GPE 39 TaxID=1583099 RepID=UPI00126A51A4|nr:hypothetical protein [Xanthomonas sp. GPE 39]
MHRTVVCHPYRKQAHIRRGLARWILIASYGRGGVDADRIQSFGVVSDAASACLVSAQEPLDFKVRGFAQYADVRGMHAEDDFDRRKRVNAAALAGAGVSLGDIRQGVLHQLLPHAQSGALPDDEVSMAVLCCGCCHPVTHRSLGVAGDLVSAT